MLKSRFPMIPLGICTLLFFNLSFASHPERNVTSTFDEFLAGEFDGVSVTSEGKLMRSPAFDEILDTKEAFVYSAVFNRTGALFIGTGNNGKVFRIDPAGSGELLVKLDEAGVYALAVDFQNRLYAGTAPDGKVYRISTQGEAQQFYDPGEKYIWDLAFDSDNNLYVATGPRGIIYKVDPSGTGEQLFDSEDIHIVSLEWDLDGNLLAGSSPGGFLYRVTKQGKPFVLLDSSLEEIKSVVVDRYGHVFAAALSGGPKPGDETEAATKGSAPNSATKSEATTVKIVGVGNGKKLEVYRIDKDYLVDTIYTSDDELVFDMVVRDDGSVLLATGNKGRIMAVSPRKFATLLVESDEEQVTRLLENNGTVYAATSNLGKVFKLGTQPPAKGVYESAVVDAGMVAKWGTIRWTFSNPEAGAGIQVFTRTGNTRTPDRTWSDWEGPYNEPQGSQITSTPARLLQWKIEFGSEARGESLLSQSNAVDSVSVSYLQRNIAPKVTELTVHAAGVAFKKYPKANSSGGVPPGGPDGAHANSLPKQIRELETPRVTPPLQKGYIPGARSFSWKARDENGDSLLYSLYYRQANEDSWRLIVKDLTEHSYTLDGLSFGDGIYFARIVASDKASNPTDQALEDRLESKAFVIANSLPVVEWKSVEAQGSDVLAGFSAKTTVSSLYQVEVAMDTNRWEVVLPEDGVTDESQEDFAITLSDLKPGPHTLKVRIIDEVGNLGTYQRSVQVH